MIALILGGLGLFLLGISLMTDGLKLAGGRTLQFVLQRWTNSVHRAFLTGFFATALVQSSSAVTVSVIGFVNAGLLNLRRSVWVIFGSNVGTTMTAWIVALIGLKMKVDLVALPAIGIGAFLYLFSTPVRWRATGGAVMGIGLVFFGLQLMQDAFAGVGQQVDLAWLADAGLAELFLLVLIGIGLTAAMQSSIAALAVVLTAVAAGVLPLIAGAAAAIGANVGTTVTALLAVIKATPAARRVAGAHVIFNLLAALVAFVALVPMLSLVAFIQGELNLDTNPAVSLALFHTLFNLAGVLLMLPFWKAMVVWLEAHFGNPSENLAKTQYLDSATAESPSQAVHALMLEQERLMEDLMQRLVAEQRPASLKADLDALDLRLERISDFISEVSANRLPKEISRMLQEALGVNLHLATVIENRQVMEENSLSSLPAAVAEGVKSSLSFLQRINQSETGRDGLLLEYQVVYDDWLEQLKRSARHAEISMRDLENATRYLATLRRVVRQYAKARDWFDGMRQHNPEAPAPA